VGPKRGPRFGPCRGFGPTEGFSGADIAEVCNKATRFAIKMSRQEHIRRERLKEQAIENGEEIPADLDDDSIYVLTQQHFALSRQVARKSVSEADIARYRMCAETMSLSRGIGGAGQGFPEIPAVAGGGSPQFQNQDDNLFGA